MKQILKKLYKQAEKENSKNIIHSLKETGPHLNFLDVGCWDGENTLLWARAAKAAHVYGIETVPAAAKLALKRKIKTFCLQADKDKWPIKDHSLNCVVSNQVIEHLTNSDHFFSESSRVLAKGGYLITSTNNLSSWHNLLAILLGWAPFDLTNASSKITGIGNPLAVHSAEGHPYGPAWTHKCIYTIKWLSDWAGLYGFKLKNTLGAGYYPLPAFFGRVDPNHSAFITLSMQSIK